MASSLNETNLPSLTKVLLLGAIAAASAFVVTILIVLLCVGCQRKGRTKNAQTDTANHRMGDMNTRQNALRTMSKSDTRLHEMSRRACNGKGTSKNRPASMDVLLLPRQRSTSDLHCSHGRQLPQIPPTPGEGRDHTYSEVGHRTPQPHCPDDSLSPAHGNGNGLGKGSGGQGSDGVPVTIMMAAPQDPITAEYACIRKVKKVDRAQRKESEGELGEQEQQCCSNVDLLPATPPLPPCAHEVPRKTKEGFHMHPFPKEAVFMGNGEQYIWKPPGDDDIAMLQHKLPSMPHGESGQSHSTAVEISDMYSKICKPTKKKRPPTSPPASQDTDGGDEEGVVGRDEAQPQLWAGMEGRPPQEDPCYEAIEDKAFPRGAEESDPAYESIDANWKCDRPTTATLKPKKKKQQQQQQQQHLPIKALPSENLYESISDVKNGASSSSTTTIFTFNDGMEMYVTGL
ncbi:hypothetical protein SKAU_G00106010 [Synaphobranchus kaupii]|uniref:Lck-interacting transmembrane adapter 1 n=1 Tax=Synaphobranchus kaupii TaxID=118154 RepID=A0A9Q1G098_SYNKA|nr:hypothetical protein SKAU_G00106010 [Synaphobranchus kaupii]